MLKNSLALVFRQHLLPKPLPYQAAEAGLRPFFSDLLDAHEPELPLRLGRGKRNRVLAGPARHADGAVESDGGAEPLDREVLEAVRGHVPPDLLHAVARGDELG